MATSGHVKRWRAHRSISRNRKPHVTRKPRGSMFYRTRVMATPSFTLREYGFFKSFFLLWPWTSPDDLHMWTWLVFPGDIPECSKINFVRRCFQKLLYYSLRTRAFNTRDHFRSRDKDGGHTIRFAISENPILHANLMAMCFLPFLILWPWP